MCWVGEQVASAWQAVRSLLSRHVCHRCTEQIAEYPHRRRVFGQSFGAGGVSPFDRICALDALMRSPRDEAAIHASGCHERDRDIT